MRILITIIALACLVLVGCVQAQGSSWHWEEKWELKTEWMNLVEYVWNDEAPQYDSTWHLVRRKVYHPCQPDTVTLLVKIDSTTYYDGGTEHHWSYVSPDTVMPPGRWVKIESSGFHSQRWVGEGDNWKLVTRSWYDFAWPDSLPKPDSAYILSKPGAVPSSLREE